MSQIDETSDRTLLGLLADTGPMSVAQLATATKVTATAVRQRLSRLMADGSVTRAVAAAGRGRPSHKYSVTEKGRRRGDGNFVDLAMVLWNEIRAVKDPQVRRGLYQRIAHGMAGLYRDRITGNTPAERMNDVVSLFADRKVPVITESHVTEHNGELPVLTVLACPYPELAEKDRGICAMERMLFEELLETNVRLTDCRMDGDACCRFAVN